MQLTRNQKIEKHYFDLFCKHYELPKGLIKFADKPDVLILGEGEQRALGIEIAHLYKMNGRSAESEQKQSINRLKVIDLAEDIYRSERGRKIELNIGFDPKRPIMRRKDIEKVAKELAVYALKISSQRDVHLSYSPLDDTPELAYFFHDGKEHAGGKWRLSQSFDVPTLSIARVRELVTLKSAKIRHYESCAAYWLLLIVDFWDPSQDQSIHWPENECVGPSPFERILIYKTCFNEVVEVRQ